MSVTVEDKIEMFRKMLFGNIELDSSKQKKTVLEEFQKRKEALKKDLEEKRQEILREAEKKAEKEKQQLILKAQTEEQHRILAKKQEYISSVVDLIKQKASDYTSTQSYLDNYIKNKIEEACKDFSEIEEAIFYIREEDLKNHADYIRNTIKESRGSKGFDIVKGPEDVIGGFIVKDKEEVFQADYTILTLVEGCKDIIGIKISRMFDEVMI